MRNPLPGTVAGLGRHLRHAPRAALLAILALANLPQDLALVGGRVMDPETGLGAVRNVVVEDGRITDVTTDPPAGGAILDVSGLVVAPGFIDLHAHGQNMVSNRFQAADGVTTALELEIGTYPVEDWYASRQGEALIHYGATVSHPVTRYAVLEGARPGEDLYAFFEAAFGCESARAARASGVDVTTEAYPYTAGTTLIESAMFDDWEGDYADLQWAATGERLTGESFARHCEEGGMVIIHGRREETNEWIVAQPDIIVASDGVTFRDGPAHPRGAGCYSRVLGLYVRERGALDLMTALRKMTLLPAQRLESIAPGMQRKGRVQVGADADLTVFDPETVRDRATYTDSMRRAEGIRHVLVAGTFVVRDGELVEGVAPGQPIHGRHGRQGRRAGSRG